MNFKIVGFAAVIAGIFGFLVFLGIRNQNKLSDHLPPKGSFADRGSAYLAALQRARGISSNVMETSGTPSMEPFIHGRVFIVVDPLIRFSEVQEGDVIAYRENWLKEWGLAAHVVAQKTASGLIMAGINNSAYESGHRVTVDLYAGKITYVAAY